VQHESARSASVRRLAVEGVDEQPGEDRSESKYSLTISLAARACRHGAEARFSTMPAASASVEKESHAVACRDRIPEADSRRFCRAL
jgi:hypothetical protein